MAFYKEKYITLIEECNKNNITLVAVSKLRSPAEIMEAYTLGQRDFGENYVQELLVKKEELPEDIRWHFIGHLQTNKVKLIAPFVHLIHGVDNERVLTEINKQAIKNNRTIHCLLQVHIAAETTKFGFSEQEIMNIIPELYSAVHICGLMGMASFSTDENVIQSEFNKLHTLFTQMKIKNPNMQILSMGMSGDYQTAIKEGSNMIRVGSILFGERIK